ncbi:MAG: Aspartyl-tRNA synthetase, partial [Parcubacteria group bacterium GW2011_GWA2_46_7]
MERIFISEIPSHVGKEVMVSGWVHAIRAQGSIAFLLVRDRSGLAQAVVLKSSGDGSLFELVKSLSVESVVSVTGKVKQEAQAPGGYEIEPVALTVLSKAAPELPIPVVVEKSGG